MLSGRASRDNVALNDGGPLAELAGLHLQNLDERSMDELEGKHDVKADQRVDQFVRLRDAIEERASRKFSERPVEAEGPVVLRSNDFFR